MNDCRLLIVAHAPLAGALKSCAQHVFGGRADDVLVIDVQPEQDVTYWLAQAEGLLGGKSSSLLVLTDVFGATPFNVARSLTEWCFARGVAARVLAGVNVPMLLRAITYRDELLADLVDRAESGAVQGVIHISPRSGIQHARRSSLHDSEHHHHHQ